MKTINEHTSAIHAITLVDDNVWVASQDLVLSIWNSKELTIIKKVKSTVFGALLPVKKYVWCATITSPNSIQIRSKTVCFLI